METINPELFPIFDTHAHFDDDAFKNDLNDVILSMKQKGVTGAINCGINYASSKNCIEIAEKYEGFYAAVGVHPEELYGGEKVNRKLLSNLVSHPKVVAVGEIGLDYHWDSFSHEEQIYWLKEQILFANEFGLPVIIHDREAHNDTLNVLKSTRPQGVVHCFSGSVEMAKEILNLDMYIGLGGVVTFKNARKTAEVAEMLPLEKLLLETDAPYLAPEPYRGKRCSSELIYFTAQKIAEIKKITVESVINASFENAKRLFKKIK